MQIKELSDRVNELEIEATEQQSAAMLALQKADAVQKGTVASLNAQVEELKDELNQSRADATKASNKVPCLLEYAIDAF